MKKEKESRPVRLQFSASQEMLNWLLDECDKGESIASVIWRKLKEKMIEEDSKK